MVAFLGMVATGCTDTDEPSEVQREAIADDDTDVVQVSAETLVMGREAYEKYCQNCHGPEGKGDGPTAELLEVPPTDLTTVAARYNGEFPEETVRKMVDGREVVPAHMSREMPIWGNIWTDVDGNPRQEEEVRQRIDGLIAYLKSIQVES